MAFEHARLSAVASCIGMKKPDTLARAGRIQFRKPPEKEFTMTLYKKPSAARNADDSSPTLFDWLERQQTKPVFNIATKRIAARYAMPLPTAAAIASLAGFVACEVRA
jgi:hypothetical protein